MIRPQMPRPPGKSAGKKTAPSASHAPNRLRIIGGRWRGSRIVFPPLAAIRPSPDRVRETLFNWLQQPIVGARCLDLFAGSGALGLEALSRGAAHVTFVDREPQADFSRPVRHDITEQAVYADRCERERDNREERAEARHQSFAE